MKVFKFGGASVRDAHGVRNVAEILQTQRYEKLVVVVSAMGKSTNQLERVLNLFLSGGDHMAELAVLKEYHTRIIDDLFPERQQGIHDRVNRVWKAVEFMLEKHEGRDERYDQVVCSGEIVSTLILHEFLRRLEVPVEWVDARDYIATDRTFREANVDWEKTCEKISALEGVLDEKKMIITQGFIGSTQDGLTTTLGRDGSDFTAAIFGSCLNAESVTIWKDVPGVMNADPRRMAAATVFDELPFKEAAEMTYYGASVIHPKTIKPIANKGIPLFVKSFDNPGLEGTKIYECRIDRLPPLIVFKDNQCLVSCKVTDYTFITEAHLSRIFDALSELNIHLNLMQNSAISFSFCIDFSDEKLHALADRLQHYFEVYYNTGLTLITVKNYDEESFENFRKRPGVLMEQSSRSTLQVLVRGGQV